MREPLLFSGIRWSGAKVVARRQVVDTGPTLVTQGVPRRLNWEKDLTNTLIIETTGKGRPYSVVYAEAWWRDFADLSIDDESRVLSFLARRGDPLGELAPDGKQISTHRWISPKAVLEQVAQAWDPRPDETGVSRFHPESREVAGTFLRYAEDEWTKMLGVHLSPDLALYHSAKVLVAYMCAAAAASLRAGLDMRRCDYCSSWFTLHYATARQCSASCRAARFNNRRSPHGFVPQDHDSQGGDPVAESVADSGTERPPAGPLAELRDPEGSEGTRRPDARDRKPRRRRSASA